MNSEGKGTRWTERPGLAVYVADGPPERFRGQGLAVQCLGGRARAKSTTLCVPWKKSAGVARARATQRCHVNKREKRLPSFLISVPVFLPLYLPLPRASPLRSLHRFFGKAVVELLTDWRRPCSYATRVGYVENCFMAFFPLFSFLVILDFGYVSVSCMYISFFSPRFAVFVSGQACFIALRVLFDRLLRCNSLE